MHANEASLHRLEEMKAFARITAPFDGVITARNVDIGTLINSGNGGASRELFHIAQIQVLRIFVNVPQTNVGIHAPRPNRRAARRRNCPARSSPPASRASPMRWTPIPAPC